MTEVYIIVGLVFLLSGLIAALKIGMWFWIATRIFGRPGQQYQQAPIATVGSAANGLKKWLSIIVTVLGIISTTIGLVEKCGGDSETPPVYNITPYTQPMTLGSRCCTPHGACVLITGAIPIGSPCTCNLVVAGRVCQ
jgi:hypothetical protein